ncbi:MAG: hypothetical protein ABH878_03640 [bacterium]
MISSKLLMIFIDGLGVGKNDAQINPLAKFPEIWPCEGHSPSLPDLHHTVLDACLGVQGLPQSATGQTALLTGINAAQILGKHLQGFPSKRLIRMLEQHSVFLQLQRRGFSATFANAYRHPEDIKPTSRLSVTSHALRASQQPFRSVQQIAERQALYHDFTNRTLTATNYSAPIFTPKEAASVLVGLANQHHFTLYEYFLTDVVAHRGDSGQIEAYIAEVTRFVKTIFEIADTGNLTVILTSDHGNIEDLTTRTHTRNPVPLLWMNPTDRFPVRLPQDITGVTPLVVKLLCDSASV